MKTGPPPSPELRRTNETLWLIPMDPEITPMPELSNPQINVCYVSVRSAGTKGARVYGILCEPKAPGKDPSLLNLPSAGVRGETGEFSLSFGLARLSRLSSDLNRVVALLGPPMLALAKQTGLSAKVSVQDGDDWLMIAREEARKDITISLKVGTRAPVFLGSVGAVLCAGMDAAALKKRIAHAPPHVDYRKDAARILKRVAFCRRHGYATDFAETHPSIHALSVPVRLNPLNTTGAITLFGLPGEVSRSRIKELLARLQASVRGIEEAL